MFYEAYKDAAAFETHASSEHFKAFADAITDLLDGDLLVEKF
ncbi:MAG: putative quinol monooxygenase [Tannerella forsythia]